MDRYMIDLKDMFVRQYVWGEGVGGGMERGGVKLRNNANIMLICIKPTI